VSESLGMDSCLGLLALEIQGSLVPFDRHGGGIAVDRLLLVPMEQADRLRDGLAGNLALPVEVLDVTKVLDVSAVPEVNALPSSCFHAIGAALRMEDTQP